MFVDVIEKHSKNIIDLLEVGDVIKYIEQTKGRQGTKINNVYITDIHSKIELNEIKTEIKNNGIGLLSLVTHEQFESIEYKI